MGRLSEVQAVEINDTALATPEVTTYSYDLMGNLQRIDYANGMIADYQYDSGTPLVTTVGISCKILGTRN